MSYQINIKRIASNALKATDGEDEMPADNWPGGDVVVGGPGGGGTLGDATDAFTTLQIPGPVLPCITQEMELSTT